MEEPSNSQPLAEAESSASEPQAAESRWRKFLYRAVRWILAFAVVISLGFVLAIFLLYTPTRARLNAAQQEASQLAERAQDDAAQAEAQIAELEAEIERIAAFEERNQELETELERANLHIAILSARADVAEAQLALAQDDAPGARLALSNTSATLDQIAGLLPADQQSIVANMQERLALAVKGTQDDAFAAASDLNVLATSLLQLEEALFASR